MSSSDPLEVSPVTSCDSTIDQTGAVVLPSEVNSNCEVHNIESAVKRHRKNSRHHKIPPGSPEDSPQQRVLKSPQEDFYLYKRKHEKAFNNTSSADSSPESNVNKRRNVDVLFVNQLSDTLSFNNMNDLTTLTQKIEEMQLTSLNQFNQLSSLINAATTSYTTGLDTVRRELAEYKLALEQRCSNLEDTRKIDEANHQASIEEVKNTIQTRFNELDTKLNSLNTLDEQHANPTVQLMQARIDKLEREARKLNIVIKGLKSTSSNAKIVASEFIEQAFKLQNVVVDAKVIPIMKLNTVKIIAQLDCWESKMSILRGKSSLKSIEAWSSVFIEPDLTATERKTANKIEELAKDYTSKGKPANFGYTWLVVDGTEYYWSVAENKLKQSSNPRPNRLGNISNNQKNS